jgi:hypothetical protein
MEILDYLRIIRKRIAIVLIVPLVAAGAAAVYVLTQPVTYSASATVSSATLVGGNSVFTGPQATSQFVAAFSAAATGPTVIKGSASSAGVGVMSVRNGLAMHQAGASSDMVVSYTGIREGKVQDVLSQNVKQTLDALFKPRAQAALQQRDTAQASVTAANAAVAAFAKKVGMADPAAAYQAALNLSNSLAQQRLQLRANANYAGAVGLDAPIKAAQDKLAGFGPILAEYNDLVATQHAAEQDLATAQAQYRQAQSLLQASEAPDIAYYSATTQVDVTSNLLTLVLPVFVAGLLLAFVLVISLEMLRGAKRAPVAGAVSADADEAALLETGTGSPVEDESADDGVEVEDDAPPVQGAGDADVEPAVTNDPASGDVDAQSAPVWNGPFGDVKVDDVPEDALPEDQRMTAGAGEVRH